MIERRREVLLLLRLREKNAGVFGGGMKDSSRREAKYWVRLEAISQSVWYERKFSEHHDRMSP
jgi:hypothetical protein